MTEKKEKDGRKINTGGGAYVEGGVAIVGSVSHSTIVVGTGITVTGKVEGLNAEDVLRLLRELRGGLPRAGIDADTQEIIDADIQVVELQLAKPEPKKHIVLPKLESVVATLTGLVGAGEAVQKLLPMAQQAVQWVQQVVK